MTELLAPRLLQIEAQTAIYIIIIVVAVAGQNVYPLAAISQFLANTSRS